MTRGALTSLPTFGLAWRALSSEDLARIGRLGEGPVAEQLDKTLEIGGGSIECAWSADARCYGGWNIVELLIKESSGRCSLLALLAPTRGDPLALDYARLRDWRVLDGTALPFHAFNYQYRYHIDRADTAKSYLRLYCGYLALDDGKPMHLIETEDDLVFLQGTPRFLVTDFLKTVSAIEVSEEDDEEFTLHATALYNRNLYLAVFRVTRWGLVRMHDDERTVRISLPVSLSRWESPVRVLT